MDTDLFRTFVPTSLVGRAVTKEVIMNFKSVTVDHCQLVQRHALKKQIALSDTQDGAPWAKYPSKVREIDADHQK